ncbi:MAG: hypothetical protein U0174_15330 [Polyangiaceae bacterium]
MNASSILSKKTLALTFALFGILSTGVGCAANADSEEETASDDAELARIPSAYILGDLTYGKTSAPVAYKAGSTTNRYRAFRFQGEAGDTVKVRMQSATPDRKITGFLLDSRFKTIVQQEGDASRASSDTYFEQTLEKNGTYYLAFRESQLREGTFTVSLRGVKDASRWGDPFDSGVCGNASVLNSLDMRAALGTLQERTLGSYKMAHRERSCTTSGCGAWTALDETKRAGGCGAAPAGSSNYLFRTCNAPGDAKLVYDQNAGFQVTLGYKQHLYSSSAVDDHVGSLCTFGADGKLSCNPYGYVYTYDNTWYCNQHACSYQYADTHTMLEIGERPSTGDRYVRMSGSLKDGCLQMVSKTGGRLGQQAWYETESAILVKY